MYVIKSLGDYIVAAPRPGRLHREGCCVTRCKIHAAERLSFGTPEQARQWLAALRDRQREAGLRPHQLARGLPVPVGGVV
jgi:hypothetical protein